MSDTQPASLGGENPVDQIIADYLEAVERSEAPDPQTYLQRYPQFATELQSFFQAASQFRIVAGPVIAATPVLDQVMHDSHPSRASETSTIVFGSAGAGSRDESLPVGNMFGEYELLEEIARGGMGVVFKARHRRLNRLVALKMILAGQLASAEEVKRFQAEAQAAAGLDHPGIVPVYEVGEHHGQHYFAMGFVDGVSLARRLIDGPLHASEAASFVEQIADAVQYAHEHGIIHRDLKPGNVLLQKMERADQRSEGKRNGSKKSSLSPLSAPDAEVTKYVPRITDFGLAKQLSRDSQITRSNQILGTPSYMPPEQASGKNELVGPAADIYSIGAILYCLLVGRPPFQAASPLETLLQVQKQDPPSPRSLNSSLPQDLDTVVMKCLEKDPSRRYSTAREVADELRRFQRGEPILARRISRIERAWRWCRRNPLPAALGSTAAMTLLAATIVSVLYARSEHQRASDETTAKNKIAEQSNQIKKDSDTIKEQSKNIQAEHEAGQQQLAKAFLAEARALRMSGRPGQRFGALRAIRESMKITGPTRALADEAVAALCLPDWEVDFEWEGFIPGTRRLVVSPNFDRYARVNDKNVISIRTLPDDREVASIEAPKAHDDYAGIRFSDDGRFLFERFNSPFQARAWLLTEKSPRLIADEMSAWADSLDGRHVVIAQGTNLRVIDSAGEHTERLIPMNRDIADYLWRGKFGHSLIAINYGSSWQTINLQSGRIGSLYASTSLAAWPAFHPNGSSLLWTHNQGQSCSLNNLETGERLAPQFMGHKNQGVISAASLSQCGSVAFTNDWGSILRMWDVRTGRSLMNRPFVNSNNWSVVSADNRLIGPEIVGSKARWLRFATGREFGAIAASADKFQPVMYIDACAMSHDGRLLAYGTSEGLVLYDVPSGLPLTTFATRRKDHDHVVGFTDTGHLVSVENRQMVRREIAWPNEQTIKIGPSESCGDAAQIGDGLLVRASCSRDGSVRGLPLNRAGATLIRMQPSPDGGVPLTGFGTRVGSSLDIRCVSVSPDGKWLATGQHWAAAEESSSAAKVWSVGTGKRHQVLSSRGLCNVAFSSSGRYLTAHSGETAECQVFETNTWTPVGKFLSKANGIFSLDDSLFAVESGPGEISLRRGPELNEFARLAAPDEHTYRPVLISPDNSRLFACNLETQTLHVWNLALIRKGLNELGLADGWPDISTASTPDVTPPLPRVLFNKPASSSSPTSNVASQSKPAGSSTTKSQPQKQYSAAEQLASFEKNLELQQWSLALMTSQLRARLQRWTQATEDFKVLLKRNPEQHLHQYQLLILLAHLQDEAAFREHSKKAIARFANDPQPFVRDRIAKACFLVPRWCDDIEQVYKLVDRPVADPRHQGMIEWFAIARGWMLLLKREHAAAITTLEAGLREMHASPEYSRPQTLLLLALAHKASGHAEKSVSILDTAQKEVVSRLPAPGNAELSATHWHEWLVVHSLLREAQVKVLGKELTFAEMVERTGETPFQTVVSTSIVPAPQSPPKVDAPAKQDSPSAVLTPKQQELKAALDAVQRDPGNSRLWTELAHLQAQLLNFSAAAKSANEAWRLAPNDHNACFFWRRQLWHRLHLMTDIARFVRRLSSSSTIRPVCTPARRLPNSVRSRRTLLMTMSRF